MDNLTSVSQAAGNVNGQLVAGQSRSYSYDSLGRLATSITPESGTVTNYYTDSTGNPCAGDPGLVCRVQDARGVIKTFSYDSINRVTGIQYSDQTPGQTYNYDTGGATAFALGRLTKSTDGLNSQTYSYDNLGRISSLSQVIDQSTYLIQYGYNPVNQLTSLTYPTTRVISQGYDALGRLSSISDGTATYLNSFSYNAAGQALGFTYGNGVQGALTYNDHLRIATLRYYKPGNSADILNLSYDYGANDNGKIQAVHYYTSPGIEDSTKSEYFNYDVWSHLSAAHTGIVNATTPGTWSLTWVYDRLGNRLQQNVIGGNTTGTNVGQAQFTIDPNTNRITNGGFAFDAAGNLTADGTNIYSYDGANRMKQLNSGAVNYTYFGSLRIKKSAGISTTVYVYSGSQPIIEYLNSSVSKEYVYSGSKLLATISSGSVIYHHPDHLSNRAETDSSGNIARTYGHAPFGENWYETGTTDMWKLANYARESESGLDYAQFRYYAPGQGRFLNVDLMAGSITAPQSLNRYQYVTGDPVNFVDPLGLFKAVPCYNGGTPVYDDDDNFLYCDFDSGGGGHQTLEDGGGGGGGGGPAQPAKPKCKDLNLDNAQTFWDDQFATPDQVQSYFQDQGVTQNGWDGAAAANEFIAAGINPGLAVGIINAETSFGNSSSGLSARNTRDPFSSGGKNFSDSLSRAVGVVTKLEDHTFTDNTPLSALVNKQNDAGGYRGRGKNQKPVGQAYDTTAIKTWLNNVEQGFRDLARFLGLCDD